MKVKTENNKNSIKIRLNLEENDSLYEMFTALKLKTGINASTEVLRYAIKRVYDIDFESAST